MADSHFPIPSGRAMADQRRAHRRQMRTDARRVVMTDLEALKIAARAGGCELRSVALPVTIETPAHLAPRVHYVGMRQPLADRDSDRRPFTTEV